MFLILQSDKIENGFVKFNTPQYVFDDQHDKEFRIVDCFISLCHPSKTDHPKLLPKLSNTQKVHLLSLRSNLIDRSTLNSNQDLFFMSVFPMMNHVHYQPTNVLRYKLKLMDLNDLVVQIHSTESVLERIEYISIQIEIVSYRG